MEQVNQDSSNEVVAQATQTETVTQAETSQAPAVTSPDATSPSGQPAWTPDFKFKVMDKEYEIDPLLRPVIKDEETLKKVRRMQEQVTGLPHLEASRDEFKNKYNQVLPRIQEYDQVEKKLDKLSYFVQNQDFDSFFNDLKIPEDAVFSWVKRKLDLQQAPAEVRQNFERANQLSREKYEQEQELSSYRARAQMQELQSQHFQLDQTIEKTAGNIAQQFNERIGEPMAFKNAVINKGYAIQEATGQRLPVEEVVALVTKDLQRVMGLNDTSVQNTANSAGGSQPHQAPPVIPVIKAGGSSPVKTAPRSLKELRELAAQM